MTAPDPKNLTWFRHEDHRRFVAERLGSDPWITVYESRPSDGSEAGAWFSALVPNASVDDLLTRHTWDLMIGSVRPGFTVYGDEKRSPEYNHFGVDGPVPLVLVRTFESHREKYCELLEEFRLFHNLYQEARTGKCFKVDDNGDEEEIARVTPNKVEVKLRAVRQFCAVKEMHLAVYFEFDRFSKYSLTELGLGDVRKEHSIARVQAAELLTYELYAGDWLGGQDRQAFSRLAGKKLFAPLPIDQCGLDPYEDTPEFAEFIIGTDRNGKPLSATCDPERLSNNFGKNEGAPHFLTPVFFKREVLAKYFGNPSRYEVHDSRLNCHGSWGLRLDNNHKDYVIVFLGDLGQSLGHKEQLYWKSFNISPDGSISTTNFRRSVLGEWADAESADLVFKAQFDFFQKKWAEATGWPLFKPLAEDDAHLLTALHIPLLEDQSEFDAQVLALTKTLVDSLNEEMMAKDLHDLPKEVKGIAKFDRFCSARGLTNMAEHIQFLRELQGLRSTAVAHRKGENYEKAAAKFRIDERGFRETFDSILKRASALLETMSAAVAVVAANRTGTNPPAE